MVRMNAWAMIYGGLAVALDVACPPSPRHWNSETVTVWHHCHHRSCQNEVVDDNGLP